MGKNKFWKSEVPSSLTRIVVLSLWPTFYKCRGKSRGKSSDDTRNVTGKVRASHFATRLAIDPGPSLRSLLGPRDPSHRKNEPNREPKSCQNRCFKSDGFLYWLSNLINLSSRNIVARCGKAGLRDHPGYENPFRVVFRINASVLREFVRPETIFVVFRRHWMSREMSSENAYTQDFRFDCHDGVSIASWLSVSFENTLRSVRGASAVEIYLWKWSIWAAWLSLENVFGHLDVDGNFHPTQNNHKSIPRVRNCDTLDLSSSKLMLCSSFQAPGPRWW